MVISALREIKVAAGCITCHFCQETPVAEGIEIPESISHVSHLFSWLRRCGLLYHLTF